MRNNKKYSNQTFTKRVDHEVDHNSKKKLSDPTVCVDCSAVYTNARWTFEKDALSTDPFEKVEVNTTICPACVQLKDGVPEGFVYIKGEFLGQHRKEIGNLLKNEEKKMLMTNPLARIMKSEESKDSLTITTTTVHLAQHLGRAVNHAYGGDIRYDFSHENKLVRVYCERE